MVFHTIESGIFRGVLTKLFSGAIVCFVMMTVEKPRQVHLFWSPEEDSKLISLKNQGLSYREISEILGRSVSSVEHRWRRLKEIGEKNSSQKEFDKLIKLANSSKKDILNILKEQNEKGFEKLYLNLKKITLEIMKKYVLKNKILKQEEAENFLAVFERYLIITDNLDGLNNLIEILEGK